MGTVTIRPDSTVTATGWTITGAGTADSALADDSDASYVTWASGAVALEVGLENPTIPTGAQYREYQAWVRWKDAVSADTRNIKAGGTTGSWPQDPVAITTSIATASGIARAAAPFGVGAFTAAVFDAFTHRVYAPSTVITVYEVGVDLVYNEAPVVTITGPADPVTDTTYPSVVATYNDAEGDALERAAISVFTEPAGGWATLDPDTNTDDLVWSAVRGPYSDVFDGDSTVLTIEESLTNGVEYRAYVWFGDSTPNGYDEKWSAPDYVEFTIDVDGPDAPTITGVAADNTYARTAIVVISGDSPVGATNERLEVQRLVDGEWQAVRFLRAYPFSANHGESVSDFYAPRHTPLSYRARIIATIDGQDIAGGWSATAGPVTIEGDSWWLKSSSVFNLELEVCVGVTQFPSSQSAALFVFAAEGRRLPIVHAGTVRGEVFPSLPFLFDDDAEWLAFNALRDMAEPLLVQTTYGDTAWEQFWVRLGDATITRYTTDAMGTAQIREVDVQAIQVDEPPES